MNGVIALLISVHALAVQEPASWRDPSPHQVRFVNVDASVRVEVLDGGGKSRPTLFVGYMFLSNEADVIRELRSRRR